MRTALLLSLILLSPLALADHDQGPVPPVPATGSATPISPAPVPLPADAAPLVEHPAGGTDPASVPGPGRRTRPAHGPVVLESVIARDRAQLGVLRAQLDRFSLKVDANLQEQWGANNLFGPTIPSSCNTFIPTRLLTGGDLVTPLGLYNPDLNNPGPTPAQCQAAQGLYAGPSQIQSGGFGLLNLSANLQVPVFSGFRVTANVARARLNRDAAGANIGISQRNLALTVLRAYWNIRLLEMQQAVSEKAVSRYDDAVTVVAARVRAGLAPPVDLNTIETRRQTELARLTDWLGAAKGGAHQPGRGPGHTHRGTAAHR